MTTPKQTRFLSTSSRTRSGRRGTTTPASAGRSDGIRTAEPRPGISYFDQSCGCRYRRVDGVYDALPQLACPHHEEVLFA